MDERKINDLVDLSEQVVWWDDAVIEVVSVE